MPQPQKASRGGAAGPILGQGETWPYRMLARRSVGTRFVSWLFLRRCFPANRCLLIFQLDRGFVTGLGELIGRHEPVLAG